MRRPGPERRRRTVAATLLVLPAVLGLLATLTGCGAGAVSQTARQASAVNGVAGAAGPVLVRDATIAFTPPVADGAVYRVGQSADLNMTLVNTGSTPDELVSVSSPVAGGGQIIGEPLLAPGSAVLVGNNAGNESQALASRTIAVKLVGLNQDIRAGLTYPVVLRFQRAGELTVQVPVGYPTGQLAERE